MDTRSPQSDPPYGRCNVPHLQPYLPRPRLRERLNQGLARRMTLLCAGAGFGKTTALHEFASSCPADVLWIQLTKPHRDPARFFRSLSKLFELWQPGFGGRALAPAFNDSDLLEPIEVVRDLLGEGLARLPSAPLVLILDDFQNVCESPAITRFISELVSLPVPDFHLFVSSRTPPGIPMARLRAQRELVEIQEDELAFMPEESASLLSSERPLQLSAEEVTALHARTEGWAAGLTIAVHLLQRRTPHRLAETLQAVSGSAGAMYDYLAEEVFNDLPLEVQSFLMHTSILGVLHPDVCDAVTGSTASRRLLMYLERNRLFTTQVGSAPVSYRYHQLFRSFLREKLRAQEAAGEVARLHALAAASSAQLGDHVAAVSHYLEAGDSERAADLLEQSGLAYLERGEFDTVEQLLNNLPPADVSARPWLLAFQGRLRRLRLDLDGAMAVLEGASQLFEDNGDAEGRAWALGEAALVSSGQGNYSDAIARIEQAIATLSPLSPQRPHLLNELCWVRLHAGPVDAAIAAGREGLMLLHRLPDRARHLRMECRLLRNLAHATIQKGDISEARRLIQQGLQTGSEQEIGHFDMTWLLLLRGITESLRAEGRLALESLDEARKHAGRHNLAQNQLISWWQGNTHRNLGQYAEAFRRYEAAGENAAVDLAHIWILDGRVAEGHAEARRLHTRYRDCEAVVLRGGAHAVLAIAEAHGGQDAASEHFRRAEQIFESRGFAYHLASVRAHHAAYLINKYERDQASELVARVVGWMHDTGMRTLCWWDKSLSSLLAQEIDESPRLRPLLKSSGSETVRDLGVDDQSESQPVRLRLMLRSCSDSIIRRHVISAVEDGNVALDGLEFLRREIRLTWREIDVFITYCMGLGRESLQEGSTYRARCATALGMAESTIKCHIRSIRDKAGFSGSFQSPDFWEWARARRLLPIRDRHISS